MMQKARKAAPVAPCLECDVRYPGCHAYCMPYKEYRAAREKYLEPIKKRKEAYNTYKGYNQDSYAKFKRSRRGKK